MLISSCASALFINNNILAHKMCNVSLFPHFTPAYLVEIDEGTIFIVNSKKIISSCKNEIVAQSPGCSACVVELQCHCSLTTDIYFIPPRIDNCNYNSSSTLHVMNLAIIQHMFDYDTILMIKMDSLL